MITEGPYLGLRTYEERDADRFFGREDVVSELVRMVRRSALSVLFGVSGIGKSSLVQAGMFPAIRAASFLPISIRLDFSGQRELLAQVRDAIAREIAAQKLDAAPPPAPPLGGTRSLIDYFLATPLWTRRNRLLTPVLVFDQFEEAFTLGRDSVEQVRALMNELAALVERRGVELGPTPDDAPPEPRVVMSLREDFLAHLEDYRPVLPSLLSNRLRLTHMTGPQALQAVREPAPDTVSGEVAGQIVQFVAAEGRRPPGALAPPLDSLEVEPTLLSLVCDELDRRRRQLGATHITEQLITEQGGEIVERFYVRAFQDMPEAMRSLVEDYLVTPDERRTTMALEAAIDLDGVTEAHIKTLIDRRVLRSESRFDAPHIELMHDRLTRSAVRGREQRKQARAEAARKAAAALAEEARAEAARKAAAALAEEARAEAARRAAAALAEEARAQAARRRRRKRGLVIGLVTVFVLGAGTALYVDSARKSQIRANDLEIARLLTNEAQDALVRGESAHAADLLQHATTRYQGAQETAPPDAQLIYKRAIIDLAPNLMAVDHGSELDWAVRHGGALLTGGRDGTFKAWTQPPPEIAFRTLDVAVPLQATSPRQTTFPSRRGLVVVVNDDGSGEVRKPDGYIAFTFGAPSQSPRPDDDVEAGEGSSPEFQQQLPAPARSPPRTPAPSPPPRRQPTNQAGSAPSQSRKPSTTAPVPTDVRPGTRWDACVARDGKSFAVWVAGGLLREWRLESDTAAPVALPDVPAPALVLCLDGARLVVARGRSGDASKSVIEIIDRGAVSVILDVPERAPVAILSASSDGSTIAADLRRGAVGDRRKGMGDLDVYVWRFTSDAAKPNPIPLGVPAGVVALEVSDRGDYVAVTARRATENRIQKANPKTLVAVWDAENHLVFAVERPLAVARWVPGGDRIVVASTHRIEGWHVRTWSSFGTVDVDREVDRPIDVDGAPDETVVVTTRDTVARVMRLKQPTSWGDRSLLRVDFDLSRWALAAHAQKRAAAALNELRAHQDVRRTSDGHLVVGAGPGRPMNVPKEISLDAVGAARSPPDKDGRRAIAVVMRDGTLDLYDETLHLLRHLDRGISRAEWSSDRRLVMIAQHRVEIWSAQGQVSIETDAKSAGLASPTVLWTCTKSCRAWSLTTRTELASLSRRKETDITVLWGTSMAIDGATQRSDEEDRQAFLLPPIPPTGMPFVPHEPVAFLASLLDGAFLARGNERTSYTFAQGADVSLGVRRELVDVDRGRTCAVAAEGRHIRAGGLGEGQPLSVQWDNASPVVFVRCGEGRVAIVDESVALSTRDLRRQQDRSAPLPQLRLAGRHATFSGSGARFAVVAGSTIEVWATATETLVGRYDGVDSSVQTVLVSETSVVAAVTSSALLVWNRPGQPSSRAMGQYGNAALTVDGKFLVAGKFLDEQTGPQVDFFQVDPAQGTLTLGNTTTGESFALDARGARVAVAQKAGAELELVSLGTFKVTRVPFKGPVLKDAGAMMFRANGNHVWFPVLHKLVETSGDALGAVKSIETEGCVFGGKNSPYAGCIVTTPGPVLRTLGMPSGTKFGEDVPLPGPIGRIIPVVGHDDDRIGLAIASNDATNVYVWKGNEGMPKPFKIEGLPSRSQLRLDRGDLLVLDDNGWLRRYRIDNGALRSYSGGASVLDLLPLVTGDAHVAIRVPGQGITVHRVDVTGHVTSIQLPGSAAVDARFISGAELMERGSTGEVAVWHLDNVSAKRRELQPVERSPITAFEVLGGATVAGHANGKIQIWKNTTAPVVSFGERSVAVRQLAFDDGGHWLASSSDDGVISVWNLDTTSSAEARPRELLRLNARGRDPGAPTLAFARGDPAPSLLVGTADGDVTSYVLGGELPRDTADIVKRNLASEALVRAGR